MEESISHTRGLVMCVICDVWDVTRSPFSSRVFMIHANASTGTGALAERTHTNTITTIIITLLSNNPQTCLQNSMYSYDVTFISH